MRRYAVLTDGLLTDGHAKTAHGVMQYGRDATVAVIDAAYAGKSLREVLPRLGRDAPIVADVAAAMRYRPTSLLVGVATTGGFMPPNFRAHVLEAIHNGLEIVNGLHHLLRDDAEFSAAARASGARLWDVRVPPADIPLFSGAAARAPQVVALAVGSDCAIGKMSVMLELESTGKSAGARPEFIATGQTGILIAGRGIAVDRVISDFVTGAAEQLVCGASRDADVLLVEGQGSILHPAYAPVTLGLMLGSSPDLLILCHECGRDWVRDYGVPIPDLKTLARMHEALLAPIKPAPVIGVALNTSALSESAAKAAIAQAHEITGLPADDVVRFGAAKLWAAVRDAAAAVAKPRAAAAVARKADVPAPQAQTPQARTR